MSTDINILARVEAAMASDTEAQEKQSDVIAQAYQLASPATRAVLDDVFAALCGWSLRSILAGEDTNGDECDEDGATEAL
jgi:hypothetical protein